MATQDHATDAKSDRKNQSKLKSPVVAGLTDDMAGLAQLLSGPTALAGDGTIQTLATRLGDSHLQIIQRQTLAAQIMRTVGNHALQRVIANIQRGDQVMRDEAGNANLDRLRTLLDEDHESEAIGLMSRLTVDEVQAVLSSVDFKNLAVSAFNNDEMYQAVMAMKGNLNLSLEWLFEEGTDWEKVKAVIPIASGGFEQVRARMRDQFVSICNNAEMSQAVDLLGGDLAFKLSWMREEGTNWDLVRAKLVACTDDAQKGVIRGSDDWKAFFIGLCNNDEMGLAVQLLGGTLAWQLTWMRDEGVDWQRLVQIITGCSDDAQKRAIRESDEWRQFFVGVCNNEEMARVTDGLGGDLQWRLSWLREEGTSWELVARQLRYCREEAEKQPIRASESWKAFFVTLCNNQEMSEAVELLGGDLSFKLQWMAAEGADWPQLREKLALCTDEAQKLAIRTSDEMKNFFVSTCGNNEMAEAVNLLGGDLAFKLEWMNAEGTDWPHVQAILRACSDDSQKQTLRESESWKQFFVGVCNNREMAEALDFLGGDLRFKLSWMQAEGTDWASVRLKLIACQEEAQKQAIREDEAMKALFVSVCDNQEMAEAVDLLGGDLDFKLSWMREEGTTWQLVREKFAACTNVAQLQAVRNNAELMAFLADLCSAEELVEANSLLSGTAESALTLARVQAGMSWNELKAQLLLLRDETTKSNIRGSDEWRNAFVGVCNNEEMAEAVDILGGNLGWKLSWMKEEGTNWQRVREKLQACTDDGQKQTVRQNDSWKSFFVDLCGGREMAEAVRLLGGDLAWKLGWMLEVGTSTDLILPIVNEAPQLEKDGVGTNNPLCGRLREELGDDAMRVFEALNSPAFMAAILIDRGGTDEMIQAIRIIVTSTNVATTVTDLRSMGKWNNFLDGCPKGSNLTTEAKTHVDTIYNSGGCTVPERKKLINIRYNIEINDAGIAGLPAVTWTQPMLDAVYQVLAQLPEGTVLDNDKIEKLHMVVSGIGTYYEGYHAIHLPGGPTYSMTDVAGWSAAPGLTENHFRGTVRHEMGHAIDVLVNGREWYMNDPNIDWDEFGSVGGWLASMEANGGWGPVSNEAEREQIRQVISEHFADPGASNPSIAPADPNHPFNKYPACQIVQTANLNLVEGCHTNYAAMTPIGGRIFTRRPDYRTFYSYKEAARNRPMFISAYGLSAPEEWFAEQLREYFRTSPVGQNCAEFSKNWFRMNLP